MSRFILRYRGKGPRPAGVAEMIRSLPDATIIDDSGRMILVDAPEGALRGAVEQMASSAEWLIAPERVYSAPEPRARAKKGPASNRG